MPEPLVSIICPLYNKFIYVKETIGSVLNQTYENWELIIVDDGSTDGSYELVEEWAAVNERVKLYKRKDYKQNKGGSVCRNIGITLAKGEYIIFLDADDLLLNHCLKNRLTLAQKYPLNQFYVFNHALFNDIPSKSFQQKAHYWLHKIGFYLSTNKELWMLSRFLKYDLPWTITNVLWKIETLRTLGGFDESFQRFQDPEIHTKALLLQNCKIQCFKYTQKPDALIRIDKKRHTSTLGNQKNKFSIYVDAIELYLTKFHIQLKKSGRDNLLKKLNGYLFSADANINYLIKECATEDKLFYDNKRIEVKNIRERIKLKKSFAYDFFIKLHSVSVNSEIGKRIKLPAVIYKLYMFIN